MDFLHNVLYIWKVRTYKIFSSPKVFSPIYLFALLALQIMLVLLAGLVVVMNIWNIEHPFIWFFSIFIFCFFSLGDKRLAYDYLGNSRWVQFFPLSIRHSFLGRFSFGLIVLFFFTLLSTLYYQPLSLSNGIFSISRSVYPRYNLLSDFNTMHGHIYFDREKLFPIDGILQWLLWPLNVDTIDNRLGINIFGWQTFNYWSFFDGLDSFSRFYHFFNIYFDFTLIGLLLSILTSFLYLIILFSILPPSYPQLFNFCYLSSFISLIVTFSTNHLFIFYMSFEFILIPFFFIVAFWGSRMQRFGAALRLILFTLLFSLPFTIIIFFNLTTSIFSFNFSLLSDTLIPLGFHFNMLFYVATFLAFAVKIPLFPAHIWLPEVHGEAPTFGSVLLAGVLLKLGGYGLVQVCSPILIMGGFDSYLDLFPLFYTISILTILYSNFSVFVQTDIKRIIAYYSIGHMGFVTLGLATGSLEGWAGASVIMLSHGLSAAGLFFAVGYLYELTHTRSLFTYRGVATVAPIFATLFFVLICANMGIPGTLNFIGEQLVFTSLMSYSPWSTLLPALGVLLNGFSSILFCNRILFGEATERMALEVRDFGYDTVTAYGLVLAPLILVGFFPSILLSIIY